MSDDGTLLAAPAEQLDVLEKLRDGMDRAAGVIFVAVMKNGRFCGCHSGAGARIGVDDFRSPRRNQVDFGLMRPLESRVEDSVDERLLALIDLSSLAPKVRVEADISDAVELALDLLDLVVFADREGGSLFDLDLRFYGGFRARDGSATHHYSFLLRQLKRVHGLRNGLRIFPRAVDSLAVREHARISGTFRGGKQRMVDQMLAQDALFLSDRYATIGVIADDEDYFPAMLSLASLSSAPVRWVRQREVGRNDAHLIGTKVKTLRHPMWQQDEREAGPM